MLVNFIYMNMDLHHHTVRRIHRITPKLMELPAQAESAMTDRKNLSSGIIFS